jgi:hypothetical protein
VEQGAGSSNDERRRIPVPKHGDLAARALANEVYDAMAKCRDFDFRSQIQRAAASVMNNHRFD